MAKVPASTASQLAVDANTADVVTSTRIEQATPGTQEIHPSIKEVPAVQPHTLLGSSPEPAYRYKAAQRHAQPGFTNLRMWHQL